MPLSPICYSAQSLHLRVATSPVRKVRPCQTCAVAQPHKVQISRTKNRTWSVQPCLHPDIVIIKIYNGSEDLQ
eukprot:scaffold134455_cov17-Tisochrysis_lutea.AAC.1